MKERIIGLISVLFLIPIVLSSVSGRPYFLFDSDTSDVTLTVTQEAPTIGDPIILTENTSSPSEGNPTTSNIYFVVNDANGKGNITNSSVWASYNKSGESSLIDTTCTANAIAGNNTAWNYSCSVQLEYYTTDGAWDVTFSASDGVSTTQEDDRSVFEYGTLSAIDLDMSDGSAWTVIAFGSVAPGSTDQGASNEPYVINNTGNQNLTTVEVTGLDLKGDSDSSYSIETGNFTTNTADSTSGEDQLSNNSAVTVTDSYVDKGAPATGKEELYFFVDVPATLMAQDYSPLSSWTISAS